MDSTFHHLCATVIFYGGIKLKEIDLYTFLVELQMPKLWPHQNVLMIGATLLQQTSISFMVGEWGHPKLPTFSSHPRKVLLGLEELTLGISTQDQALQALCAPTQLALPLLERPLAIAGAHLWK